ncbi:hypothetical protein B0H17DRAFT_1199289 [Mycena rosella]|uniref:Uncharacterized protein n=1 Tax=Mycena rosella TaxID=1033263 RepID=A0AAD7GLB2_MYCRO|nr:hypothetical protein B0H17DRAFT_1199289 [Mycena rosella]
MRGQDLAFLPRRRSFLSPPPGFFGSLVTSHLPSVHFAACGIFRKLPTQLDSDYSAAVMVQFFPLLFFQCLSYASADFSSHFFCSSEQMSRSTGRGRQ